ncbi:MAG: nucleotide exchange factor GrpE [Pseudomonadota bacterium]
MAEQDKQQETVPEAPEGETPEELDAAAEGTVEEVGAEDDPHKLLEDMRAKADEHWNEFLRSQAELENLRRRSQKDVENARKFALEKFANELLPVIDSLEMGLASVPEGEGEASDKVREGMELTRRMFASALEKFNIVPVEPEPGEAFDPERHQAMSAQESAEYPPNSVVAVMQKGYTLNDRLLRPAMVMVAKAPEGD